MTKVTHTNFGTGTVIEQDAKTVTVDFNGTVKKLMTAFSRLTNEDGTAFGKTFVAPVKTKKRKVLDQSHKVNMTVAENRAFQEEMQRKAFNTVSF
jgi:hypothetical protein